MSKIVSPTSHVFGSDGISAASSNIESAGSYMGGALGSFGCKFGSKFGLASLEHPNFIVMPESQPDTASVA